MFSKRNFISFVALLSLTSLILACGSTETVEVVKEVEIIKEVPIEKVVTEERVVEKVVEVAAPDEDTVDLTWGKKKIEGVFGLRWQGPYRTSAIIDMQGVEEPLFIYKNGTPMEPYTAESWDVSADGKLSLIHI